jgi:hypothetical protein
MIYHMNTFDGQKEQGGCLDVYGMDGNTWPTVNYAADGKSGPEARSVSALLALLNNGKNLLVTLFGEHDSSLLGHAGAGTMLSDVWAYDIAGEHWGKLETKGDMPQPRGSFDADTVRGNEGSVPILLYGGLAADNSRLGGVWIMKFD